MTDADKTTEGFWVRFIKQAKDFKELVAAFGLASGAVVAVYKWSRERPSLACGLVIGAIGLICFLICLYAYRKRREASRLEPDAKGSHYGERLRTFLLLAMAGAAIVFVTSIGECFLDSMGPPTKTIVLVANFAGPDPQNYRLTERLLLDLENEVRPFSEIRIQPLNETISEQDGMVGLARTKGSERKASIVIWGSYGMPGGVAEVSVHFELLRKIMTTDATTEVSNLSVPDWLQVRQKTINETKYLVLFTVGLAKYVAQDFDAAADRLGSALAQKIVATTDLDARDGFLFHGLAELKKNRPDIDAAIKDFTQMIERGATFEAYQNLGVAYTFSGKAELAISSFREAIKLKRDKAAYLCVAVVEHNLQQLDAALEDLDKAIELAPDFAPAHSERCLVLIKQNKLEEAIQEGDKAALLDKNFATAYNNRGLAKLKIAEKNFGDPSGAITDFNEALRLSPRKAIAYFNRGQAYTLLAEREQTPEHYKMAVADYTRAIEIRPTYAKAYAGRAIAESRLGDDDSAQADYRLYQSYGGEKQSPDVINGR
jgi:tetratricopeptide (TPR) repeat protein